MNQRRILPVCLLVFVSFLFIVACGPATAVSNSESDQPVESNDQPVDEHEERETHAENDHADEMSHMHVDAPTEFASLSNPYTNDHEAIDTGAELFSTYCATCHGVEGMGDGLAAEALDPKPASLADGTMMGELSDGYLFWRVSDGGIGEPFNSAMPAWNASLTEDQRWQIISYVRTLSEGGVGHMEDAHEDEHMGENHVEEEHMDDMHSEGDEHSDEEHAVDEHANEEHGGGDDHADVEPNEDN